MRTLIIITGFIGIIFGACQQEKEMKIANGEWTFELDLGEEKLSFRATFYNDALGKQALSIFNVDEEIVVDELVWKEDIMYIRMPHFDSEFHASMISSNELKGVWHNYAKGPDYVIPFVATAKKAICTPSPNDEAASLGGKWAATFGAGEDSYPAIGEFIQNGSAVNGTFLTETGDYRFLNGCLNNGIFKLSTFDGAHAFLFAGNIQPNGSMEGTFFSGNHYTSPFSAVRDENATLRSADSLTFLKEGYDKLAFSFPDLDGNIVSLEDERFKGKAVIVQIMGSWCPNCLDETRLFNEWYKRYNPQGLEIVGLAYEASKDSEKATKAIKHFLKPLGASYPFLIAGRASKKESAESLPMLNHVMSYPTSIFIDKKGGIRKIHTGFSGPGTGKHYTDFVEENEALIQEMLNE